MMQIAMIAALCLPLMISAGCDSSDDAADSGAAVMDGSSPDSNATTPDGATPELDAAGSIDAAGTPDGAAVTDAMPERDGGPPTGDVAGTCAAVCDRIDSCSEGAPAGCVDDCMVDLGGCSAGELDAVVSCTTRPCPGLEPCMSSVPCVP